MSGFRRFMVTAAIAVLAAAGAAADEKKTLAAYGFSKDLPAFAGKKNAEIARMVHQFGFNAVFGGYQDKELMKALRQAGIRVFASVPLFAGEEYWTKYPSSRAIDSDGNPVGKTEWYAPTCPNNPAVLNDRILVVRDLVMKKDVDGVFFDFARYPAFWEAAEPGLPETCFCPVCCSLFEADTQIDIPDILTGAKEKAQWIIENKYSEWTRWKCDRIAQIIGQLQWAVKEKKFDAVVGLFAVPWKKAEYNEAMTRVVCQDLSRIAPAVDVIAPMAYHRVRGRDTAWISEFSGYAYSITMKPVWPVIQSFDVTHPEFNRALLQALKSPSEGVIVFDLKRFLELK